MSGKKYNNLYVSEITEAIKEMALQHRSVGSEAFLEVRTLIADLNAEGFLQIAIEHYRKNAARNRHILVAYKTKYGTEGWGYTEGTQWHDGGIVLNGHTAAGPKFYNDIGCLFRDFHHAVFDADEVTVIYLDTGERRTE